MRRKDLEIPVFRALVAALGLWVPSLSLGAPAIQLKATADLNEAEAVAEIQGNYEELRTRLAREIPSLLKTAPGVASARVMTEPALREVERKTLWMARERERSVLVKFQDKVMEDSLFLLSERQAECSQLSKSESDCPHYFWITLTGPIHSYERSFAWSRSEWLKGSFAITMKLKPKRDSSAPVVEASFSLELLSPSFQPFINKLLSRQGKENAVQNEEAEALPPSQAVQAAFLLWAQSSLQTLARGGTR